MTGCDTSAGGARGGSNGSARKQVQLLGRRWRPGRPGFLGGRLRGRGVVSGRHRPGLTLEWSPRPSCLGVFLYTRCLFRHFSVCFASESTRWHRDAWAPEFGGRVTGAGGAGSCFWCGWRVTGAGGAPAPGAKRRAWGGNRAGHYPPGPSRRPAARTEPTTRRQEPCPPGPAPGHNGTHVRRFPTARGGPGRLRRGPRLRCPRPRRAQSRRVRGRLTWREPS